MSSPTTRDQPSGVVTLLFTDIEGSTRLLHTLPTDLALAAFALHGQVLREAFARHGGYEQRTEGDSFFVVFQDATSAVAAAVLAQRSLAAQTWPGGEPVRVRMGLHTGEPTPVDGDYVGIDVHRAARIAAAGHGGQVLLSRATRSVAELPDGVSLRDLGEHRLKDLAQAGVDLRPADRGPGPRLPSPEQLGDADQPSRQPSTRSWVGRPTSRPWRGCSDATTCGW